MSDPDFMSYCAHIHSIVEQSNEVLEGNCVYEHETLNPNPALGPKRENFLLAARGCRKICEIGFNAGHSAFLLAKAMMDGGKFLIFDLGFHTYTIPSFNVFFDSFSARGINIRMVLGDSTLNGPMWIQQNPGEIGTFDLVHVDGGHTLECIVADMATAVILTRPGGLIIVDDMQSNVICDVVNKWVSAGLLLVCSGYQQTFMYPHVVLQKVA